MLGLDGHIEKHILNLRENIAANVILDRVMAGLRFNVQRLDNGTFTATLLQGNNNSEISQSLKEFLNPPKPPYDDRGALYYVVAVILIYGISIVLMISSSVRKSKNDNGVNNYVHDMDKVRQLERRQQKFKTRMVMQKKRHRNVLYPNTGIRNVTVPLISMASEEIIPTHAELSRSHCSTLEHDSLVTFGKVNDTGMHTAPKSNSADYDQSHRIHAINPFDIHVSSDGEIIDCDAAPHLGMDTYLSSERSPSSLVVLQEEEDEIDELRTLYMGKKDRHVIISIDNIEKEVVASFV